jgi:hypothetical protein
MEKEIALYMQELKFFAREARKISGSPMKKHIRTACKSHAEHFTRKTFPSFRLESISLEEEAISDQHDASIRGKI